MDDMTGVERVKWEQTLEPGDPVEVWWGYGSGFRAAGVGVIEARYPKSFRVRLTEPVHLGGTEQWPAGFILKGIPRYPTARWHPNHAVYPIEP